MPHAGDIRELCQFGGRGICLQVSGGLAQVDHGPGELHDVLRVNAQLSGCGDDLRNVLRRSGRNGAHLLNLIRELCQFLFCRIDSSAHIGKGLFVIHGGLDRSRRQAHDRGGEIPAHGAPHALHAAADCNTLFREGFHGSPGLRPGGRQPGHLTLGGFDLRVGLLQLCPGIVQVRLGFHHGRAVVLQGLRFFPDLALKLCDLGLQLRFLLPELVFLVNLPLRSLGPLIP